MSVPKFPEFELSRAPSYDKDDKLGWKATTDTGRPGTPLFTVIHVAHRELPKFYIEDCTRERLQTLYKHAHPDGCPGRETSGVGWPD